MKIKYVFTDLDGTLIDSQGHISERNIKAIEQFVHNGGFFSVATGRSELIIDSFLRYFPINFPVILFNGAGVYDLEKKEFLLLKSFDNKMIRKFIEEAIERYPEVNVESSLPGKLICLNPNGIPDHVAVRENQPMVHGEFEEDGCYIKLLLYGKNEGLKKIEKLIREKYMEELDYAYSADYYLEILPHCNKGTALQWIMEHFNIDTDSVAAIGDYDNDMEMVEAAGLGVAVANARSKVIDKADLIVSDNDHDAIWDLLERIKND